MQHLQLAFVNERLLTEDEAKLERLRNFYRNRPVWNDTFATSGKEVAALLHAAARD
jgi:hypothetical protein